MMMMMVGGPGPASGSVSHSGPHTITFSSSSTPPITSQAFLPPGGGMKSPVSFSSSANHTMLVDGSGSLSGYHLSRSPPAAVLQQQAMSPLPPSMGIMSPSVHLQHSLQQPPRPPGHHPHPHYATLMNNSTTSQLTGNHFHPSNSGHVPGSSQFVVDGVSYATVYRGPTNNGGGNIVMMPTAAFDTTRSSTASALHRSSPAVSAGTQPLPSLSYSNHYPQSQAQTTTYVHTPLYLPPHTSSNLMQMPSQQPQPSLMSMATTGSTVTAVATTTTSNNYVYPYHHHHHHHHHLESDNDTAVTAEELLSKLATDTPSSHVVLRPSSLLPEQRPVPTLTSASSSNITHQMYSSLKTGVGRTASDGHSTTTSQLTERLDKDKTTTVPRDEDSSSAVGKATWNEMESPSVGHSSSSRQQRRNLRHHRSFESRSTSCGSDSLSNSSSSRSSSSRESSLRSSGRHREQRSAASGNATGSAVGGGGSVKSLVSQNSLDWDDGSLQQTRSQGDQKEHSHHGHQHIRSGSHHNHHRHHHHHRKHRHRSRSGANTDTELSAAASGNANTTTGSSASRYSSRSGGSLSDSGDRSHHRRRRRAAGGDRNEEYSGTGTSECCSGTGSRPTTPTTSAGSYAPHSSTGDLSTSSSHHNSLRRSTHRRHHRRGSSASAQDRIYALLKELVMTERTYKKDLEVICVWLRKAVASGSSKAESRLPQWLSKSLFSLLDPIYDVHVQMLKEMETRLTEDWGRSRSFTGEETGHEEPPGGEEPQRASASSKGRIGELFLNNLQIMLAAYRKYFEHQEGLLNDMEAVIRADSHVERGIREFETQKLCYLPLYTFFLKPMHRLLHYRVILERMLRHFEDGNADLHGCRVSHAQIVDVVQRYRDSYRRMENRYQLLEVQRDLMGLQRLSGDSDPLPPGQQTPLLADSTSREFIRLGWLQKLSKKGGPQPRMFFLFSDQLIYASRAAGSTQQSASSSSSLLQFKVHGQFALRDVMVEECSDAGAATTFTVYSGRQCFVVVAPSEWHRDRWVEDISRAILAAKSVHPPMSTTRSAHTMSTSNSITKVPSTTTEEPEESNNEKLDPKSGSMSNTAALERQLVQARANTATHVCWHRNLTLAMADILRINEHQISGYLLRKFKNSQGWQKLWVVFGHACLFFYKSYQDESPLASLPLLGYSVAKPETGDHIRKEHVFKLHFRSHVYFFRVDNAFTFERWFEVLSGATSVANRGKTASSASGHHSRSTATS